MVSPATRTSGWRSTARKVARMDMDEWTNRTAARRQPAQVRHGRKDTRTREYLGLQDTDHREVQVNQVSR